MTVIEHFWAADNTPKDAQNLSAFKFFLCHIVLGINYI